MHYQVINNVTFLHLVIGFSLYAELLHRECQREEDFHCSHPKPSSYGGPVKVK